MKMRIKGVLISIAMLLFNATYIAKAFYKNIRLVGIEHVRE